MKRKIIIALCVTLAVAGVVAGFVLGRYYIDNKAANFSEDYVLYVYPETTAQQVIDSLVANAGVKHVRSLYRTFDKMAVAERMKPGRYEVKASSQSIYVARMLVFGWQSECNLTLSGTIRSKGKLARQISNQLMVDSATVAEYVDSAAFLAQYGFTPENVFAMILPDTYRMYWTASMDEVFGRFKREYDAFWTPERMASAAAHKLNPMEVSVLASIVSGETIKDFEYPVIAGVYLNRLRKGMKLQADPTVAFCFDYEPTRILKKHLQVDSPYNTYKYAGLPPTPINIPPKACIEAVLNPDNHGYLYFCASPDFDLTHRFAVTYSEHLKNAREFQRALTARQNSK